MHNILCVPEGTESYYQKLLTDLGHRVRLAGAMDGEEVQVTALRNQDSMDGQDVATSNQPGKSNG
jgi:hypothetical protein